MISNLSSVLSKLFNKSTSVSSVFPIVLRQYSKDIPWRSIGATIPVIIWFRDTFFTIYHVNGSSMEPTLYNNDIIIVRKCDWGILTETFCTIVYNMFYNNTLLSSSFSSLSSSTSIQYNNDIEIEKERIVRNEWMSVMNHSTNATYFDTALMATPHYRSWIYESPVLALNGHVIIFYHPNSSPYHTNNNNNNNSNKTKQQQPIVQGQSNSNAPAGNKTSIDELCIKRIVGMGGQWISIRPNTTSSNEKSNKKTTTKGNTSTSSEDNKQIQQQQQRQWQILPVYTFYVEGDNKQTSIQLNDPLSKHLLLGIAEYVIWPLSRFGTRINRQCSDDSDNDNDNDTSSKTLVRWM